MTVPIKGGKPRIFETPEDLQAGINDYFAHIDRYNADRPEGEKPRPYTMSGICVYLGIAKDRLWEYGKKSEYAETIKEAKARVESCIEEGSLSGKWNTIGAIFNLKNNFGWVDKIEVNTTTSSDQLTNDDIKAKINELKKPKSVGTTKL